MAGRRRYRSKSGRGEPRRGEDSTLEITYLGHAGLFIETRYGSILCDPWFGSAYFASWFPFPSNEGLDRKRYGSPTYLYLSHLHLDHYDPDFLSEYVSKDTTVLLPDYPLPLMERELRRLGFTRFIQTTNNECVELDGLKVAISASVAPTDGPLGDSGLIVDDGETRIYDQNDSRPLHLDKLQELGPYDVHLLQFSGAIWHPMVYNFPPRMKQALGTKKRRTGMERAHRYTDYIGARYVVPSAGPPCFLDDPLYGFNDFESDPANTFPDHPAFRDFLESQGRDGVRLMMPGSVLHPAIDGCPVEHALPADEVWKPYTEKRAYLDAYKARKQPQIDRALAALPRGQVEIVPELKAWFEPLLEQGTHFCVGVNGRVLLDCGDEAAVIDFQRRQVHPHAGEHCDYRFYLDRALIESLIVRRVEDWINELFLSCRFRAERSGPYNEYVYNFFKCLSPERLAYAEGWYAEKSADDQFFEVAGYRVQRRCPHLRADLTRFGHVEDGVLTCTMHGWQFELATGRCLTSDDAGLYTEPMPIDHTADEGEGEASLHIPAVRAS